MLQDFERKYFTQYRLSFEHFELERTMKNGDRKADHVVIAWTHSWYSLAVAKADE